MRKLAFSLSAAALALTLGLGGAGAALAQHHGGERGPAGADTNGDGVISLAETKAKAAERFARMDANSDGQISAEDREERRAQRFARTDTDGNGELSQDELAAAREARSAAHEARRTSRSETRPAGERGERGERRTRGGERGGRHRGMQMLQAADTNQDRAISKAEFDAAVEARFARVDTDGSGTITAEERQTARAAMRAERRERGNRSE